MERIAAALSSPDGCPHVPAGRGLRAYDEAAGVDSMRSNLACEVTDNILCCLPLSAHHGLYRRSMTVESGSSPAMEQVSSKPASLMEHIGRHPSGTRRSGARRRQISRMNSLFPVTHDAPLYGLSEGMCCADLPPAEGRGDACQAGLPVPDVGRNPRDRAPRGLVVVTSNQRTADVGTLLEHGRDGVVIRQVPVGVTVKTMMSGTVSGRVDLVLPQDRACNKQDAVAA